MKKRKLVGKTVHLASTDSLDAITTGERGFSGLHRVIIFLYLVLQNRILANQNGFIARSVFNDTKLNSIKTNAVYF